MVLWVVYYVDEIEMVEFGELYVFSGVNFVIMVCYFEFFDFGFVCKWMEEILGLMDEGVEVILYVILDVVVDGYVFVVDGVFNDIDEIEM